VLKKNEQVVAQDCGLMISFLQGLSFEY